MRLKTSKILLVAGLAGSSALGGSVPAWAHAHKPAAKPEATHASAAKAKSPAKAPKHEAVAKSSAKHAGKVVETAAAKRKPAARTKVERTAHGKREAAEPAVKKGHSRELLAAGKSRFAVAPRAEEVIVDAAPEPVALPEIHVTHNRKLHLQTPAGDASQSEPSPGGTPVSALPRKATPADFLTPEPAAAERAVAPAPRVVPAAKTAALPPPATPVPVVAVIRKPAEKPQIPAAKAPVEKALVAKVPEPPAVILPALYTKRGKLIVPAALKGSHDILVHQNVMADHDGLERIQDDEDLERMRESKLLVSIPQNAGMRVDERLPANRRYTRPWTASFLTALARAHYDRFHSALQVNSAVRTVEFQQRLIRTNGNAAPAEGETASPHLTGQAVDLAKKGLSLTEIAWLRGYLLPLVQEGKVDVEEEFQQACFHVSVYRKYMPQAAPPRTITPHHTAATAIAAAIR